jgi:hypothetical protein
VLEAMRGAILVTGSRDEEVNMADELPLVGDPRMLSQVADRTTTKSFKQTINAAILLRAARPPNNESATPRKTRRLRTFLGLAGLFVGEHEESLRMLIHHL